MSECQCTSCTACHGNGFVMCRTGSYPEEEPETCWKCRGTGIGYKCRPCREKRQDAEPEED